MLCGPDYVSKMPVGKRFSAVTGAESQCVQPQPLPPADSSPPIRRTPAAIVVGQDTALIHICRQHGTSTVASTRSNGRP